MLVDVDVADIDAIITKAKELGAAILVTKMVETLDCQSQFMESVSARPTAPAAGPLSLG
jgi:hypothetical protein